jgi:hypothetical protein
MTEDKDFTTDERYQELLQTNLDFGKERKDRTGTGTKSISQFDRGGGGGSFNGMWTAVKWSEEEIEELDIMGLKALMHCIFLKVLIDKDPRLVQGRRFVARNDNQPWVAACNSNDSTKPAIKPVSNPY